jgi:geranylgeranyl pyrophosphate synthase
MPMAKSHASLFRMTRDAFVRNHRSSDEIRGRLTLTSERDASAFLAAEQARIDAVLARSLERILHATSPVLADPIRYAVSAGGKRIRPVLCVLAHRAAGGAAGSAGADDVACSLELIHTYSLVHDDLPCMDDDDLRRGRPTVHRVFGSPRAAIAGAAMIPLAFRLLEEGLDSLGLAEDACRLARQELARGAGAGGMVGGQVLDLAAEQALVELPGLREIHSRKTGALFVSALRLGGIAAGGTAETVDALGAFGEAAGLAFQIVDDVLDETGDATVLGKTAGKDRAQEKATFPALLGRDEAMQQARTAVHGALEEITAAGLDPAPFHAVGDFILNRDR